MRQDLSILIITVVVNHDDDPILFVLLGSISLTKNSANYTKVSGFLLFKPSAVDSVE